MTNFPIKSVFKFLPRKEKQIRHQICMFPITLNKTYSAVWRDIFKDQTFQQPVSMPLCTAEVCQVTKGDAREVD